jgi:MFS family permease
MFIGSLIIVIGTCIQASCKGLAQFMVGRFILGFGVAICASAGPAYVAEMAHPKYRGALTGFYNTFWFVGGITATFVPVATHKMAGTASWRIPIWGQMIFSGMVVLGAPFLPESPRWLMAHEMHEEAMEVMTKYHGDGDRDSIWVRLEYQEMLQEISVTGSDKRWWDYRQLFNSKEARYRTMLVVAMAFFGQVRLLPATKWLLT